MTKQSQIVDALKDFESQRFIDKSAVQRSDLIQWLNSLDFVDNQAKTSNDKAKALIFKCAKRSA